MTGRVHDARVRDRKHTEIGFPSYQMMEFLPVMTGVTSQRSLAAEDRVMVPSVPVATDVDHLKSQARQLEAQKAFEEAAHAWTQYLERHPDDGEAANELGKVLTSLDRYDDSLVWFRRSLMSQACVDEAKLNLGLALRHLGRHEEALSCFQEMVASNPEEPAACLQIGLTLKALNRADALKWVQRAHDLRPANAEVARELGDVLRIAKRNDEAIEAYRTSVALLPDYVPARSNLGSLLMDKRSFEDAAKEFQTVVALSPADLGGWLSLGAACLGAHRYADALRAYRRALVIQPACAVAYCNMALALLSLERLDEAVEACQKALMLEPNSMVATFNLSCVQLAAGDFDQGWANYETRYRLAESDKRWALDEIKAAPWAGESLRGKTILALGEQGNGDLIQFARYAAALEDLGAKASFLAPKRLHRLFSTLPGNVTVIEKIEPEMRFDYQCSLLTFPARFRKLGLPIPTAAFLSAEPDRVAAWREKIGDHGFRIGIIWQGNRRFSSLPAERAAPTRRDPRRPPDQPAAQSAEGGTGRTSGRHACRGARPGIRCRRGRLSRFRRRDGSRRSSGDVRHVDGASCRRAASAGLDRPERVGGMALVEKSLRQPMVSDGAAVQAANARRLGHRFLANGQGADAAGPADGGLGPSRGRWILGIGATCRCLLGRADRQDHDSRNKIRAPEQSRRDC
jgi:tetratricopeptide (TPR) repeat protein